MNFSVSDALIVAPLSSKGVAGTQLGNINLMSIGTVFASFIIYSTPAIPETLAISCGSTMHVVTP